MHLFVTLAIFLAGLGLAALGRYLQTRPRENFHVPIISPITLTFIGIGITVLAGSHLLTIFGIQHGRMPR